jgi:nucleotidyltransferase substrate binding protein (TIGR01987 family)
MTIIYTKEGNVMTADIRWIQRYNNYERALELLKEAITIKTPTDLEIEGMIQRFEYTFELAWKTLKDYLEEKGYTELVGSKEVIRQAFADGIINEGEVWMDMIKARNLTTHIYNKQTANHIKDDIVNLYYKSFRELYDYLKAKQT